MAFMANCLPCRAVVHTVLTFLAEGTLGVATTKLLCLDRLRFDALFRMCLRRVSAALLTRAQFLLQQNLLFMYSFSLANSFLGFLQGQLGLHLKML